LSTCRRTHGFISLLRAMTQWAHNN